MRTTEVLAIEVKQYVDADGERQTIVPRLIGHEPVKPPPREWSEQSLLEQIARQHGEQPAAIARSVIDWAKARDGVRVVYGKGARDGSAQVGLEQDGASLSAFRVWSYGRVEIPFDFMRYLSQAPFSDSRAARDELRDRINAAVADAQIPSEALRPRPSFGLAALADEQARQGFFAAIEWAFDQAHQAQAETDA